MDEHVKQRELVRPFLVDSHAHLELEPLVSDVDAVVRRASAAGVGYVVTVGIDLDDAKSALALADRFETVFACVGFHPHNAKDVDEEALLSMETLAHHSRVVGYGEIGLDFFRNLSPRDRQIDVFADQLSLAQKLAKPVVIHLRDAYRARARYAGTGGTFPCRRHNPLFFRE